MRWEGREQSKNVIDSRRGKRRKQVGAGLGIGSLLIIGLALFLGQDPSEALRNVQGQQAPPPTHQTQTSSADDQLAAFVGVVLKDCEDVWNLLFREQLQRNYEEPKLEIFTGQVSSRCGMATAASGPFYCPGDDKVYIDLSFYQDLKNRFQAPGDFAMAYVVAHEVAHHVQNQLGITMEIQRQKGRISEAAYNDLSVRLELQADFLAGVWAHHAHNMKGILERGDIEEAMNAAHAIGDDRIQMQSRGYVVPDSFTHGTSEQRMRWFKKGFETGDIRQGDTFNVPYRNL